jgi:prepilin-type N-terminal cleavage/methylation domain-containing protein
VKPRLQRYLRSQEGFTLVELMIASLIGLIVMTGLTTVVLTTTRAATVAQSRVEASNQVRNFQSDAYEDFALSGVPTLSSCAPASPPPCTIVLSGLQASNSVPPSPGPLQITYSWNGTTVDRTVGSNPPSCAPASPPPCTIVASSVTAFSASLRGAAPYQTVVVTLTVTVSAYTETQTMQFYPRVNP